MTNASTSPFPMAWTQLPDSGVRVLFDAKHLPCVLLFPSGKNNIDKAKLELEARTGWRVQVDALRSLSDSRGGLLIVTWVGQVGRSCSYEDFKRAKLFDFYHSPEDGFNLQDLVGMSSYSTLQQLEEPWKGQPKGTWVVWVSHPGTVGFFRRMGMQRVMLWALDLINQPVPSNEVSAVLNRLRGILEGPEGDRNEIATREANQGHYTGTEVLSEIEELCVDLETGVEGVEVAGPTRSVQSSENEGWISIETSFAPGKKWMLTLVDNGTRQPYVITGSRSASSESTDHVDEPSSSRTRE